MSIGEVMIEMLARCCVYDGVLVVKKAAGWTSHDVVAKIRRLLGGIKVGHGGTLDPSATGVLPILIGKATRIAEYLMDWEKEYRAVLRLGVSTDTQDATGTVLMQRGTAHLERSTLDEVIGRFRGSIRQVPPMYSAVKVGGVPLYKSARAGKTVAREPRNVHIRVLDVLKVDGQDVTFRVVCSKGTYIRALCADIGDALGVGGHLHTLERTRVGPLGVEQALTVEALASLLALGRLGEEVWTLDRVLESLPTLVVDASAANRVRHGAPVPWSNIVWRESTAAIETIEGKAVRIHDLGGRLLAIGRNTSGSCGAIAIEKVLSSQR